MPFSSPADRVAALLPSPALRLTSRGEIAGWNGRPLQEGWLCAEAIGRFLGDVAPAEIAQPVLAALPSLGDSLSLGVDMRLVRLDADECLLILPRPAGDSLFTSVVEHMQVGIVVWQLENEDDGVDDLVLVAANQAAERISKIPVTTYVGRRRGDVGAPSDLNELYMRVLRTGEPIVAGDLPMFGDRIWSGYLFPLPERRVALTFEDVTSARRLQQALRRSELHYRTIFESSHDAITLIDPVSGRVLDANPAAFALYDNEDLIGMPVMDVSVDTTKTNERIERLLREGSLRFEVTHRLRDGREVSVEVNATVIEHEGRPALLSIARDNTSRIAVAQALAASEARTRAILENVAAVVWRVDAEGRMLFAGGDHGSLRGWPGEEIERAVHADDLPLLKAKLRAAFEEGTPYEVEYRRRRADGTWRWLMDRAAPVEGTNGESCVDGVTFDITDRKETEIQQREAAEFGLRAVHAANTQMLLDDACRTVREVLDGYIATVYRHEPAEHRFVRLATSGPMDRMTEILPDDPARILGYVHAQSRPVTFSDLQTETRFLAPGLIRYARSGIAVPIRGRTVDLGAFGVVFESPRSFAEHDVAFVQTMANALAEAIERLDAETALREREARLRLIVSRLPVILWSTDESMRVTSIAGGGFEIVDVEQMHPFDFRIDDIIGEPLDPSVQASDALMGRSVTYDVFKGERELRVNIEPLRDLLGTIVGTVGIALDRTSQNRTERVLSQIAQGVVSEVGDDFFASAVLSLAAVLHADLALIAEIEPGGAHFRTVAVADDGRIVPNFTYPRAGSPCEEVVKGSLCWYERDAATMFPDDPVLRAMQVENYAGVPIVGADGQPAGLVAILNRRPVPRDAAAEAVLRIYADRAAAELDRKKRDLAQARMQLQILRAADEWRNTFDSVVSPILIIDGAGVIVRVNRAATELTRRPFHELVGMTIDALSEVEPWETAATLARRTRDADLRATAGEARDASGRTWNITSMPLGTGTSPTGTVIVVLSDISSIVELQETLRVSERMSTMGQLVAGVAHEVRNPLFGISAALDAFEAEFGASADVGEYMSVLRSDAERLRRLMNDLLDYGRPTALRREVQPFVPIVERSVRVCLAEAREKNVELRLVIAGPLPVVALDQERILQVLNNVVENAIAFTVRDSVVTIDVHAEQETLVCSVADQGPGFRADDIRHVFDPFFTRRRGGTGLGLAIVHRIVEDHGGVVTVRNGANGGAIVEMRLPSR